MQGKSGQQVLTLDGNATYAGAATLSVSGLPAGVTAVWSANPVTLSAEAGTTTLTLAAALTAKVGASTITVTAKGDGVTATRQLTMQVTQAPSLQLSVGEQTISMLHTGTASVTLTVAPVGGLEAAFAMTVSGLPAGVTAVFSPSTIAATGGGSTKLTLTGSSKAVPGTYTVMAKASGSSEGTTYAASETFTLQLK